MAENDFRDNRLKVQRVFLESNFLIPLSKNDIPYAIYDEANRDKNDTLKVVNLNNIPVSDDTEISFVLDSEMTDEIFSRPERYKTVEKVFFIFTCGSLYVIMVEMKTLLQGYKTGIPDLVKKIKDSMNRISIFLTHYLLDKEEYNDYTVKYFNLILFNEENITQALHEDVRLKGNEIVKIFLQDRGLFFNDEPLGRTFVDIIFKKNPVNSAAFDVDLNDVFAGDFEFENAVYSDKTFP